MCVNESFDMPEAAIDLVKEDAEQDPLFESVDWVPSDWWTMFDDPQLEQFICTAIARNPTLQAARENIYLAHYNANRVG